MLRRLLSLMLLALPPAAPPMRADEMKIHTAHLKDITSVEGVRDNMLMGYGLVAGLNGTGDRQQTIFSTQTLASMLQKMGVTVGAPATMLVHNIAAVFVTATLPPFAQPGMRIDATISSIGDAKSLEGGTEEQTDAWEVVDGSGKTELSFRMVASPDASMRSRVKSEICSISAQDPALRRIYRFDSITDVVKSAPLGIDHVQSLNLLVRSAEFADLFNGHEKLIGINLLPWYIRQVYIR